MIVKKIKKQFEPVVITLETNEDLEVIRNLCAVYLLSVPIAIRTPTGEKVLLSVENLLGKLND